MTPENLLAEWSRLFIESLADAGLREIVVSPGSRSTPLVWAALACPRLRARSVVDERSAAFYALGKAKITGRPAAVLCTSGSAAANYFPAIVEASLSHTPLLVITADRPFELADAGASQTIDQTKLYGDMVRLFADLGLPDDSVGALRSVRRRAAQLLHAAIAPSPGPVHVNVRARKPLEPAPAVSDEGLLLERRVEQLLGQPITAPRRPTVLPPSEAIDRIADDCRDAERGLIVCGPADVTTGRYGEELARFARASGFPVYAEATSQHRLTSPEGLPELLLADGFSHLLRVPSFRDQRPDVVVQIGNAPVSAAWERWLQAASSVSRHVIARAGFPDPTSDARSVVIADVAETLSRLSHAMESRPAFADRREAWCHGLAKANRAAWQAVDEVLDLEKQLSEGAAVRAVVEMLPRGAVLAVGNSLPVRHVDAVCAARSGTALTVVSQRGAAGIDGVLSSAAGSAESSERPTVLLVGDVSILHDLGGFAVAETTRVPFVVVVLNNDGGRIFEQLPLEQAGLPDDQLAFWTTPHGRTFEGVSRLFRIAYARASTLATLRAALTEGLERPGCTLLEVTVPPHGAQAQSAALTAAVDEAVLAARGPLTR